MDNYPDYSLVGHTFTVNEQQPEASNPSRRWDPNSSTPPSPPPEQTAPRAKMKRFDIRISHLSDVRDDGAASSSKAKLEDDGRDSASGPSRVKKQRGGRERAKIRLAPDQPPTTQGKQRERVYVACVQW